MALPLANSFEGGSQGTTPSPANSGGASGDAFNVVQNTTGTIIYDGTNPAHGSGLGVQIVTEAAVTPTYMAWTTALGTLSTNQTLYGRFYYVAPGTPTSSARLIQILNGTTMLCGLVHASGAGTLNLRATGDVSSGTLSNTALTAGVLYRIEFQFDGIGGGAGAGSATARLFLGDSTTQTGTDATTTAANFGSLAPNAVRFGITTANASTLSTYYFDGLQVNDTGMPGPELVGGGGSDISDGFKAPAGMFDPVIIPGGLF